MSRKKVFFLSYFVFAMSLFSNFVSAAKDEGSLSGVADTIHKLFGFLPNIITLEKLVGEDAAAMFWAKFLIWLLLFAVIYFGASFVFKQNKRIATVVALVIALMSALLIPNEIVINIFQTYGLVGGLLIWVMPVAAGFYLVSKIKERLLKALVYLLTIFVLLAIDKSITSTFAEGVADSIWFSLFRLVLAVVIIAFLWNLLTAWVGGKEEEKAYEEGGEKAKSFWDWLSKPRDERQPAPTPPGPHPPGPTPPGPGPVPPGPTPPPDDDKEKDTDKKELAEEKKFLKSIQDFDKLLGNKNALSNRTTRSNLARLLWAMRKGLELLNELEYKEIKLEHLKKEWMKGSWGRREEIKSLIEKEKNALNHLRDIFNKLRESGKKIPKDYSLLEESKRKELKNLVNLAKGIATLLININLEEMRKLK